MLQLETPVFLHLVETNAIQVNDASHGSAQALSAEVHRLLLEAGDQAIEIANQRYHLVEAYQNKQQDVYAGTPTRTIRDWLAHFRDAEAIYGSGYGYVGLLPKTAARGNRNPRADKTSRRLLDEAIAQWYARPKQQKPREVFLLYQHACLEQQVPFVTERTFYRHLNKASDPTLTEKRKGARAAYQESTWYWELEHTTPRHGDRPWELAHIDHTQLDIELLSSLGKPLGRPWATFLVDAYSRRLLAVYLTFDPPSYRSVMMVLRVCVRRLGRLPQTLVVDGGKEFRSRYFETLLNSYGCHKKYRPWAKPRYGSVIERLFGTANTTFVFNLLGNTQASKMARQMTKAVNPKQQAIWQLPDLYDFLSEWAYDIYDQRQHPALAQSPREAWERGLDLGGPRDHRHIRYDEVFRVLTLPGSPRETALISRNHGIQFHYLLYWNDLFASPNVAGTKVLVRFDPFDISHIYALRPQPLGRVYHLVILRTTCMGIRNGKSCWPAQNCANRLDAAMPEPPSMPNAWPISWPRSRRMRRCSSSASGTSRIRSSCTILSRSQCQARHRNPFHRERCMRLRRMMCRPLALLPLI